MDENNGLLTANRRVTTSIYEFEIGLLNSPCFSSSSVFIWQIKFKHNKNNFSSFYSIIL